MQFKKEREWGFESHPLPLPQYLHVTGTTIYTGKSTQSVS